MTPAPGSPGSPGSPENSTTTRQMPRRMPTTFAGLNKLHPLRPIRDDSELDDAMRMLNRLAGREDRTADQTDYLATLSMLIRDYEDDADGDDPIEYDDWPVHERIAHLVELSEMTASDLGELLGNRSLGSKLVRGDREPSKTHIRILADRFKVSPAFFL